MKANERLYVRARLLYTLVGHKRCNYKKAGALYLLDEFVKKAQRVLDPHPVDPVILVEVSYYRGLIEVMKDTN